MSHRNDTLKVGLGCSWAESGNTTQYYCVMDLLLGVIGRAFIAAHEKGVVAEPFNVDHTHALEIPVDNQQFDIPTVQAWQIMRNNERCLSYMVVCQRQAIVIDPFADTLIFSSLVKHYRAHITYILDTHLHSDHVSGGESLAQTTGAIYISPLDVQHWLDRSHGWPELILHFDRLVIHALATPGHTPESMSYVIGNMAFTGDLLGMQEPGRPDQRSNFHAHAVSLWHSIAHLFHVLPLTTLILPAHRKETNLTQLTMIELQLLRERLEPVLNNPTSFIESLQ